MKKLFWIETWFYFPSFGKVRLPIKVKSANYKKERLHFLIRPYLKLSPYFWKGKLSFEGSFRIYPFWINITFD